MCGAETGTEFAAFAQQIRNQSEPETLDPAGQILVHNGGLEGFGALAGDGRIRGGSVSADAGRCRAHGFGRLDGFVRADGRFVLQVAAAALVPVVTVSTVWPSSWWLPCRWSSVNSMMASGSIFPRPRAGP